MMSPDQFQFAIFFPREQDLDPAQIDTLFGEIGYSFAEKEVFFVVNTGAIATNAGDLQ